MTSRQICVVATLLVAAVLSATARAAEEDAVRNAILDSGPYPRPYLLPMPAALAGAAAPGTADWRLQVVRAMQEKGYATVSVTGSDATWTPAPGNESRIRPNMDANYELIDYGLLLGTIDLTVASVEVHGDRAEARVVERLDPSALYRLVGPLIPAAVQAERVRPGTRTVQLERQGSGWRITSGDHSAAP
jgi:hypothetical protein